jgi:hypothetical protein
MKICRETLNLVKIGQKCPEFYVKIEVSVIVAGDINSP